ncbi:MAG TPA: hypothetical protein ENG01_00800 [Candidatus Aenigmarchaeota archaeon]|nr:hypothetical protein [Candidatus Aenigmarchaeota archaeon]HEX32934.1 hypothetical protein [Candidatus Aenigmarchaeota archaeon]
MQRWIILAFVMFVSMGCSIAYPSPTIKVVPYPNNLTAHYDISWPWYVTTQGYFISDNYGRWLVLPENIINSSIHVVDNVGDVTPKIENGKLYVKTRRLVNYGDVYWFNISFDQRYALYQYNSTCFFVTPYSVGEFTIMIKIDGNYSVNYAGSSCYDLDRYIDGWVVFDVNTSCSYRPSIVIHCNPSTCINYTVGKFLVYSPQLYRDFVESSLSSAIEHWTDLERFYNTTISNQTIVLVGPDDIVGYELCLYDHSSKEIHCNPRIVSHSSDYMQYVIVHELAHRFTHDVFGNVPRWFDEGLSEYMGYTYSDFPDARSEADMVTMLKFCKRDLPYVFSDWNDYFTFADTPCEYSYDVNYVCYYVSYVIVNSMVDDIHQLAIYLSNKSCDLSTTPKLLYMLHNVTGHGYTSLLSEYGLNVSMEETSCVSSTPQQIYSSPQNVSESTNDTLPSSNQTSSQNSSGVVEPSGSLLDKILDLFSYLLGLILA